MKSIRCYKYLKIQIFPKLSKVKNFLWWIFAIGFTGMFTWESFKTIKEYIEQPYVVSQTIVESSSIELPGIRICPSTWINYTAVKEQNITVEQLEMLMEGFVESFLEDYNDTTDLSFLNETYNEFVKSRPNFDIQKFFRDQISLKCSGIFRRCRWEGKDHDCCDPSFVRKPLTSAGQCYLIVKVRSNREDKNFEQTEPGPGGGLLIQMVIPEETAEVPGLTVCLIFNR